MQFDNFRFTSNDEFEVEESLDSIDPEIDTSHFMAVLVKSLQLLDKLPFVLKVTYIFIGIE